MKKLPYVLFLSILSMSCFADIRGSRPLPESAIDTYPYNTVGVVSHSAGWSGSGTAIGNRTVITAAHVYYDDELNKWNEEPHTWEWKRTPENAYKKTVTARSSIYFEDYAEIVDASDRGSADVEAFNKDVYILQFLEDITTTAPAKWKTNAIVNPTYKMIVGYPVGYYEFWQKEMNQMHATYDGEAIMAPFTSYFENEETNTGDTATARRLFQTSSLRSTSGNSGGPVFSFEENTWTMSGIYVGGNGVTGTGLAVGIDEDVTNLIQQAFENDVTTEQQIAPTYLTAHDLNPNTNKFSNTPEGVLQIASIFPATDNDFHKFKTNSDANRKLYVFAGDVALKCKLINASTQTPVNGSELIIPAGNIVNYDINQFQHDHFVHIQASTPGTTGYYSYGIINYGSETADHIDHNQTAETIYNLGKNNEVKASISHNLPNEYFRINVAQPGHLIIQSDGPLNCFGALGKVRPNATLPYTFNDFSEIIGFDADSSHDHDFQIDADLKTGEYILMVQTQFEIERGFYSLKTQFLANELGSTTQDTDYNDSFRFADYSRMLPYEEEIEPAGDVDIRGFTMSNAGFIKINVTSTLNLDFKLYDSNFQLIPLNNETELAKTAEGYMIEKKLSSGGHYLRTLVPAGNQTGDYKLEFKQELADGFWEGYQGQVSGTKYLDWFGYFISQDTKMGLIRHLEHDFVYIKGADLSDFWIYDRALAIWFRTSKDTYPVLDYVDINRKVEYIKSTVNPRLFKIIDDEGNEIQIDENQLKTLKPKS